MSILSIFWGTLEDAQALVNQYAGTGYPVRDASGRWVNKEMFTVDYDIGVWVDQIAREEVVTNRFMIHYGKKGTHIVPAKRKE